MSYKYFYGYCRYDPSIGFEIFNSVEWIPFASGSTGNENTDYGLIGAMDGINTVFQTSLPFEPGTVKLYVNGVRQFKGDDEDFKENLDGTITINYPPEPNTKLIADFIPATT
jgi:hypothetical protein